MCPRTCGDPLHSLLTEHPPREGPQRARHSSCSPEAPSQADGQTYKWMMTRVTGKGTGQGLRTTGRCTSAEEGVRSPRCLTTNPVPFPAPPRCFCPPQDSGSCDPRHPCSWTLPGWRLMTALPEGWGLGRGSLRPISPVGVTGWLQQAPTSPFFFGTKSDLCTLPFFDCQPLPSASLAVTTMYFPTSRLHPWCQNQPQDLPCTRDHSSACEVPAWPVGLAWGSPPPGPPPPSESPADSQGMGEAAPPSPPSVRGTQ